MAVINFFGPLTGAAADEQVVIAGTASIQSAVKRTNGLFAFRSNPASGASGTIEFKGRDGSGLLANLANKVLYARIAFRLDTAPTTGALHLCIWNNATTALGQFFVNTSSQIAGQSTGPAFTSLGTGATVLSLTTWYLLDFYVNVNTGAWEVRINGNTELSGSGADFGSTDALRLRCGRATTPACAVDAYFADVVIDDSEFPGDSQAFLLNPNAAGSSAFGSQVGAFGDVDDYSGGAGNDGDSTFASTAVAGTQTLALALGAPGTGLVGKLRAVKAVVACRDVVGGFPTPAGFGGSNSGANATSSVIDIQALAGTLVDGDRVLIIAAKDGTGAFTWPSGWSTFVNLPVTFAAANNQGVMDSRFRDWATGDPTTVTLTHASEGTAWQVYRWSKNTFDSGTVIQVVSTTGDSANPDPPSHNPTLWDVENTLFIAACANDGNVAVTAAPTNYTNFQNDRWANANGVGIASARRSLAAASDDPGVFTMATEQWASALFAIRPDLGTPLTWAIGMRGNGTNVLLTAVDGAVTYEVRQQLRTTNPDGSTLTVAQLHDFEVVVQKTQADARQLRVSAMGLMVLVDSVGKSFVAADRRVRLNPLLRR